MLSPRERRHTHTRTRAGTLPLLILHGIRHQVQRDLMDGEAAGSGRDRRQSREPEKRLLCARARRRSSCVRPGEGRGRGEAVHSEKAAEEERQI